MSETTINNHPENPELESESESEYESDSDVSPENVEGVDLTQYEDDEDEVEISPIEEILASTLMTPEGDTICSALVNMSRQLEIQNKILVKLLTILQKNNTA
tara:strand:- start:6014 stop:6319 length:306 start_codon:yes stop_codon:yes gene_type:complete